MKSSTMTPMTKPAQTTKSSGIWQLAKGRHDTTMSNAVMDTHSMNFVTIGNLVSPSSSVDGDPLFDFPDHWQPRFSAQFPLRRTREGANRPGPLQTKDLSGLGCRGKPGRQAVGAVVSLVFLARQDVYSDALRQLDMSRAAWAALVFAGLATGSSLSSFSALTQSSTSFPCSPPR